MEANEKLLDFLKCHVCKDFFKIPKSLHDGHSVCEVCLDHYIQRNVPMSGYDIHEYIETRDTVLKPTKQHFICPVEGCEMEIQPNYPDRPTPKWACQFTNNLNLMSILDICTGRSLNRSVYCDMCLNIVEKEKPRRQLATTVCMACMEKVCVECAFIHRHAFPTHKDVYNIASLEINGTRKDVNSFDKANVERGDGRENKRFCIFHPVYENLLFCENCKEECCSKCRRTVHETCEHICDIEHLSQKLTSGDVVETLKSRLKTIMEKITIVLEIFVSLMNDVSHLEYKQNDTQSDIDTASEHTQTSDTDVSPPGTHSNTTTKPGRDKDMVAFRELGSYVHRCKLLQHRLEDSMTNLSGYMAYKTKAWLIRTIIDIQDDCTKFDIEVFRLEGKYEELKSKFVDLQKEIDESPTNQTKSTTKTLTTEHDDTLNGFRVLENDKRISKYASMHDFVIGLDQNPFSKQHIIDKSDDVEFIAKVNMKIESDLKECWLTDCKTTKDGLMLVTDNANEKLKWKNSEDTAVGYISLESGPWCIAMDDTTTGCITLPNVNKVSFFEITKSNVLIKESINTPGKCYGIDFIETNICVSYITDDGGFVGILSRKGREIKILHEDSGIGICCIFRRPLYVKATAEDDSVYIAVSDYTLSEIKMLKVDIDTGIYVECESHFDPHLKYPTGFDVNDEGAMLVCSCGSGSVQLKNNVLRNDDNVIFVKGLEMPRSVSYKNGSETFILTVDSGPLTNYVTIFRIKTTQNKDNL